MIKRQFSDHERYAVYTMHGEKCYMCSAPIDLLTMEIDHVLPEALLNDPVTLTAILKSFGLPSDFDLQSFANWLPSCHPCNSRKQSRAFIATPRIQLELQIAEETAAAVADLARKRVTNQSASKAWNTIRRAHGSGQLAEDLRVAIIDFASFHADHRATAAAGEPILLTPGVRVVSEGGGVRLVSGPYGVGAGPTGPYIDGSFNCPTCGSVAWNGARCVVCGEMSHD